jgi:galactokinase
MNVKSEDLRQKFLDRFGAEPRIFRAPGRVNLIGEHTDYNDGFVMPSAIQFYVWVAVASRADHKLCIQSINYAETAEANIDSNLHPRHHWSDYVTGVAVMLERAGKKLRGANLLISGDVPIGAGLSSSAAIEVATGLALLANSGVEMDRRELAKLCRKAENEYVGAQVGIMDQFVSACGHAGQALMLDCRSLEYRLLPLPPGIELVICNTMVKHELAGGEYNARRHECQEGVRILSHSFPKIRALRDVTLPQLESAHGQLPEKIFQRCRHVISENDRVRRAAKALETNDLPALGSLFYESHRSLREDYEVSCPELDLMVDLARKHEGVLGARMTGGGFGGCTVNLVQADTVLDFQRSVSSEYARATGLTPQIFATQAADGASEFTSEESHK